MKISQVARLSTTALFFTTLLGAAFCYSSNAWSVGLAIDISGVESDELNNIWNTLSITQLIDKADLLDKITRQKVTELDNVSSERLRRLHQAAPEEIELALHPFGYYQPEIKSSMNLVDDVWTVSYAVTPGAPVILQSVNINLKGEGAELESLLLAKSSSDLELGKRLLHQEYGSTKASLLSSAIKGGYLDATFAESALRVNTQNLQASIDLTLDTGSRYFFGNVTIKQEILSERFIQKYVAFQEGDVFDTDKLIQLQLAIGDSQYFDRVEITADRDSAVDFKIPILVEAFPSRPRKYTVAAGYGTDTGPRIKLGAEFRRINRRGHNIHTDFLVSSVKQSASVQYEIPLGSAGTDNLRFLSRYDDEEIDDGESQKLLFGVNYNDTWGSVQRRVYLNYLREDFRFGDVSNEVVFLTPGISLSYTKADDLLLPREGYSWFLDIHGASESVISDTTFVQAKAVAQGVWGLSDRSRLLAKLTYGATRVDSFPDLPASERFFAGGDSSVRGYAYQSIGPEDNEGNTIGGRYLAAVSVEADYLFYKDFGAALFYDAGTASNSSSFSFKRGVGTGLRWRSPVGMFRLDVANPLDDDDSNFRIHISIGADL